MNLTCNGCGRDTEADRVSWCRECHRRRVYVALAEPSAFLPVDAHLRRRIEANGVLYAGERSDDATDAMERRAAELRRAGVEHYYVYVTDQYHTAVASISR